MSEKQIDLDAMRALADETARNLEGVTQGPWHWESFDERTEEIEHAVVVATNKNLPNLIAKLPTLVNSSYLTDAIFIAHAREAVPRLTAMLRAAADEIEQLRKSEAENLEDYNETLKIRRLEVEHLRKERHDMECDHPSSDGIAELTIFGEKIYRCGVCKRAHVYVRFGFDYTINLPERLIAALAAQGDKPHE